MTRKPEPSQAYAFQAMTDVEKEHLALWFAELHTNRHPDGVMMPPDCYKPVCAFMQMRGAGILTESDGIKPWDLPKGVVDYWCDVWYAIRVGTLRAALASTAGGEGRSAGPEQALPSEWFRDNGGAT